MSDHPAGASLKLRLLGPFELLRDGKSVRLPRKAQALLAILVLGAVPTAKEILATLLWGHTGTEQARASLRQSLVALRSALAEHSACLATDGPAIALDLPTAGVDIDATTFLRLATSDDLADLQRAASLFRDTLLSGIYIPIEPFERWLAIERQRFDAARLDLLRRLAMAFAAAKENDKAIATCRQVLALDPLSEELHRLLMTVLADSGNRGSALLHYEQCIEVLKDELGVAPDPETTRLAEAIRKGILPGQALPDQGLPPAKLHTPSPDASPSLQLPAKPSVAILPFILLGDDRGREYFVKGLVEDIAVALGREAWLFVVTGPFGLAMEQTEFDLRSLGARLGVQYLLKGSVRIDADESLFVVQLLDATRGAHVWSGRFRDRMDNLFDVQERLTTKVAATIAPALMSSEVERARHQPTASLSAFDFYLRALPLFRRSEADNREALSLLSRAIELDPSYATAHALVARCYQFQLMFGWREPLDPQLEVGIRHAHEAAKVGSNDPEALWMAGLALVHLSGELDFAQALIERSLTLNPNSANAWTASCLVHSYLGHTEAAIEHFNRAQRLNPLDVSQHLHWNTVAWAYLGAGRLQEAADAAERTLRIQPDYPPGLRLKTVTLALLGRLDEARACVGSLMTRQPSISIAWMRAFLEPPLMKNRQALETYLAGARKAGVPEN